MVEVEFPDGTIRQVPSVTRQIKSREIGANAQSIFYEAPAYDPDWRFVQTIGNKWFAKPKG
ncbi:MAG: hypothetical protein WBR13_03090 [Allosphingosinicella sp.]